MKISLKNIGKNIWIIIATNIFGLPVNIGHSHTVSGPTATIESPEYSTTIGLIRYAQGSQRDHHNAPTSIERVSQTVRGYFLKIRALLM